MKDYIEFDGYCPESKLKGEKVEMLLNDMDFWESEKTGLQMTIFPPYAAILQWRGEGKFRQQKHNAAKDYKSLILTRAKTQAGTEIFPDENNSFEKISELKEYLNGIKY